MRRPVAAAKPVQIPKAKPAKLGFKDARELEQLPARIESLEREQAELGLRICTPEFYRADAAEQARVHARLSALEAEIETAYRHWNELEERLRRYTAR